MKSQTVPVKIKIPVDSMDDARDVALEILMGGIDMLSNKKLKRRILCELGESDANI